MQFFIVERMFLKILFFPFVIDIRNKLKPKIRNVRSSLKFSKPIFNLDNGRPISNPIYNVFNPVDFKYLTRLRLELSHLNKERFNHNFQDCINPLCSCSLEPESNSHFFLRCHHYTILRADLINGLKKIDENRLRLSENSLVKSLLFGDLKYSNHIDDCHTTPSSVINITILDERNYKVNVHVNIDLIKACYNPKNDLTKKEKNNKNRSKCHVRQG